MSPNPFDPKTLTYKGLDNSSVSSLALPRGERAKEKEQKSRPQWTNEPPSSHTSREFRRLIGAFHDGVLVATADGIAYANHAFLGIFGYPDLLALLRCSAHALIHQHLFQENRRKTVGSLFKVLRGVSAHEATDLRMTTCSSLERSVQLYFDSIEFEGVPAVMLTARDITESQAIQEKLNQAERMAAVGTLAAGVAHEINNPLAYVTTNIAYCMERLRYMQQLLEGRSIQLENPASLIPMLSPMERALTEAHQGTSRVAAIVRDLRALTREDRELESSIDLPHALTTAIHMAESEVRYRSRLTIDIEGGGSAWGNEIRLVQVFLNLVVNAAQAFTTDEVDKNLIEVHAWAEGEKCFVEVSDNGQGIPPENLGRVFDPFFTTKPVGEGTGLGLSICHGLIEAMRGTLTVRSEVGVRTTFCVELRKSNEEPKPFASVPPLSPDVRARILVVDDEPLILRSVARLLHDQHDVETAANGRVAFEKLENDGPFDLVVCDLIMPEMTGMELHEAIRKIDPNTAAKFVFLTGGAFTERARDFLSQVQNPKLDKPIQPNLLRSVISGVLHG